MNSKDCTCVCMCARAYVRACVNNKQRRNHEFERELEGSGSCFGEGKGWKLCKFSTYTWNSQINFKSKTRIKVHNYKKDYHKWLI